MVCKTDNSNRIAQPNPYRTVYPITLTDSYMDGLVVAAGGGYWVTVSNGGAVHLLHFNSGAQADQDINLASANYPHLVAYGTSRMVAAWASFATGSMTAQVRDLATGGEVSAQFTLDVPGHPYQSFKSFPDGSAAYAAVGSASSTIQIARILPCSG
jgi:sugar lactone lactonase YvrE